MDVWPKPRLLPKTQSQTGKDDVFLSSHTVFMYCMSVLTTIVMRVVVVVVVVPVVVVLA